MILTASAAAVKPGCQQLLLPFQRQHTYGQHIIVDIDIGWQYDIAMLAARMHGIVRRRTNEVSSEEKNVMNVKRERQEVVQRQRCRLYHTMLGAPRHNVI